MGRHGLFPEPRGVGTPRQVFHVLSYTPTWGLAHGPVQKSDGEAPCDLQKTSEETCLFLYLQKN